MDNLLQDLRHALRQMRRQPLFHLAIALTLALGIGANMAIFSVVQAVLLDPLPYPQSERLVRVWNRQDERGLLRVDASLQDLRDWKELTRAFEAFAAWNAREGNLARDDGAERIDYALISPDFFRALGVNPMRGRDFTDADNLAGNDAVAVVSHAFWRDRLGADPDAVGRTVRLDGTPMTVIGVMPPGFTFPLDGTALWKPFGMGPDDAGPREGRWIDVVARLRAHVMLATGARELEAVAQANAAEFPSRNSGWSTWIEPLREVVTRDVRTVLLLVWATVALVLLIACANVTNLLLARTFERKRELSVRSALGADRARLIRQMLVESVALALLGGVLGVLLAHPALALVARLGETSLASGGTAGIDLRVLGFALLVTLGTGVLLGVLPALRSGRTELLRSAGRGTVGHAGRLRGALVAAEVALSTTLLIAAGLLIRSLSAFGTVEVGVATENRLTLRVAPSWASVPERDAADALYRRIEERIEAVPGVTAVGAVNRLALEGSWWSGGLTVRGRAPLPASEQPNVLNRIVTPGYFDAAGIRLVRGRLPDVSDVATGQRVMAISETAARLIWNGEDPIGALVTNEDATDARSAWYTVVGIVSDARYAGLDQPMSAVGYTTLVQGRWGHFGDWGMSLIIATSGEPTAVIPAVRAALAAIDAGLPAYDVRTMRGRMDDVLSSRRHTTRLLTVFAALALLLAAIGTYAVLAFTVSRQIPEIGLRIALGATAASVAGLVLRRGIQPALIGVAMGLVTAAASGPVIGGLLFGVRPLDATTFAAIAALLSAVVIASCLLPAVRASRLSPSKALGQE